MWESIWLLAVWVMIGPIFGLVHSYYGRSGFGEYFSTRLFGVFEEEPLHALALAPGRILFWPLIMYRARRERIAEAVRCKLLGEEPLWYWYLHEIRWPPAINVNRDDIMDHIVDASRWVVMSRKDCSDILKRLKGK